MHLKQFANLLRLHRKANHLQEPGYIPTVDESETSATSEATVQERLYAAEIERLHRNKLNRLIPVNQPMVLISQIQRSGGTLLAQLFDNHPQCYSYGHELYIGFPNKSTWPPISPEDGPDKWWEMLKEKAALRHFRDGFYKFSAGGLDDHDLFPFLLIPSLQRRIFFELADALKERTPRKILDCYMTSYFNAWVDYSNIYAPQKKHYVTAFVPRMQMDRKNIEQFFSVYPDGKLITLVREPKSWFASATRHTSGEFADLQALDQWERSAKESLSLRASYPERLILLIFEDLVTSTQSVMMKTAGLLGIPFYESMLEPTFNGIPIRADSSFAVGGTGILPDSADRSCSLSPTEAKEIDLRFRGLYLKCVDNKTI